MKKNITMQDIADKVGVSKVTVSKALNDKDDISDKLKQEIIDTAEKMGYRYNIGNQLLQNNISNNIGILTPEVFLEKDETFYTTIFKKINTVSDNLGYNTILSVIDKEQETNLEIPIICKNRVVDGLIILGQLSKDYINKISNFKIPMILVDFFYEDIELDSIVTNNFEASYEATLHLIKNGHRNIGFVGNIKNTRSIMDRYLGYCRALLEHDLDVKEANILKERDNNNNIIKYQLPNPLPTAFVCNSDQAAFNIIQKLKENDISVPDDCSIIGFDDIYYSSISYPKITTVRVKRDDMAESAVKLILQRINDGLNSNSKNVIYTELIERDSVKPIT